MNTSESSSDLDQAKLVLVGGGTYKRTAKPIIDLGLSLSGAEKPRMLVVPTPKYKEDKFNKLVKNTESFYGTSGIKTDILHGFSDMPSTDELQEKIDSADMIYISGGNTRYAMEVWKRHNIDTMLARAALNGKVIAGISAGAIALFNDGMSDSHKYERKSEDESWDFTPVEGLGLIDATVTPHADSLKTPDNRPRYIHFMEMLANRQNGNVEYGLGIDENAALVAIDGLVRVVISKRSKRLHVIGGDRSMKDLDTPLRYLNSTRSDLPGSGITWSDFYRQLGK